MNTFENFGLLERKPIALPIYHADIYDTEIKSKSLSEIEEKLAQEFNDGKPLGWYKIYNSKTFPSHLAEDLDYDYLFTLYSKVLLYEDGDFPIVIGMLRRKYC